MTAPLVRLRRDPVRLLGGAAGGLVVVLAFATYFVGGLRELTHPSGVDATLSVLLYFAQQSLAYHLAVLVLAPGLFTVAALLLARCWDLDDREADRQLVATVVLVPFGAVWIAAAVSVLLVAVLENVVLAVFTAVYGTGLSTLFAAIVLVLVGLGALSGYALVLGMERVTGRPR